MSFCVDLEILYARSLPMAHGWLQKPPKPYVQVILPNRTISTPTALVRTDNPVWNHTLTARINVHKPPNLTVFLGKDQVPPV
ncbi:hypothetical protein R3P38DRAFT_3241458 [Favolaschia claudopus]|uniref:C2 domain-containing protein n=1 Tax=Favolaschia claudopus TaxID=2862362 RepID=A0AAV9Z7E3_9AGAR